MILALSMILSVTLALPSQSPVRKHTGICYLLCVVVDLAVIAAVWTGMAQKIEGLGAILLGVFTQGGLAGALFILVMFAGAVKNGSIYMRRIMPIRGELSIMASILTLGHNIAFGRTYFVRLYTSAAELRWNVLAAAICSLIMIAVMLPLFVTSFKSIRRKMRPKRWKELQRWAYLFYALMPVHILLVNLTGVQERKMSAMINAALYGLVFSVYLWMRVRKALRRHHKRLARVICVICQMLCIGVMALYFETMFTQETVREQAEVYTASYIDGKYSGAAIGYNGRLKVAVVIEEGKIMECRLAASVEDEPYLTRAAEHVFSEAVRTNSAQIDSLSGATSTADAMIEAIGLALEKAKE